MTLRTRLVLLTSVAVALAIVVASVSAWLLIRSSLMDEVDQRLLERGADAERIAVITDDLPGDASSASLLQLLQEDPIGLQLIGPDGSVTRQVNPNGGDLDAVQVPQRAERLDVGEAVLWTAAIEGEPHRVMAVPVADGGEVRLFQPLSGVEATLARIAWLLAAVAGVGVALAGGLGWVTVRAGLRPIDGLVAATEQVASTQDLGHRIDMRGHERDEVARLASAVNAMLAALDAARQQQRELVENAGHELRTPLAVLRNDLGLLSRVEQHPQRAMAPAERARLVDDLNAEVAALSELVEEVIDLARGDLEPEPPVETDVVAMVDRVVARARRSDPNVTVSISVSSNAGDTEEIAAAVRPVSLERALANLVRNAVQVSPDGGELEVRVEQDASALRVEVADRGPGIDEADLPHLFDRFYRGADARERHGSGLGLAIVAQVASIHGGTVTAANRAGGGAIFAMCIPAGHDADTPASSPPTRT